MLLKLLLPLMLMLRLLLLMLQLVMLILMLLLMMLLLLLMLFLLLILLLMLHGVQLLQRPIKNVADLEAPIILAKNLHEDIGLLAAVVVSF